MLPETRFLVQYLKTLKVGDVADYATLSEQAGVSVVDRRHILTMALDIVARDHQMIFHNIPSIGYKLMPPGEVPESVAKKRTNRIRANTKRWRNEVNNSGMSATPSGLKSLAQCSFVEIAIDAEVQKAIAQNTRHHQAIDMSGRKKKLLALFDDPE